MVLDSLFYTCSGHYLTDDIVKYADTVHHMLSILLECESLLSKDFVVEFYLKQRAIDIELLKIVDLLKEYENQYAANFVQYRGQKILRNSYNRCLSEKMEDDIRDITRNHLNKRFNDFRNHFATQPIVANKVDKCVSIYDKRPHWPYFQYERFSRDDYRYQFHKVYFTENLGIVFKSN